MIAFAPRFRLVAALRPQVRLVRHTMSPQPVSLLLLLLIAGVSSVRVYSGTKGYASLTSAEAEEEGDVPPPPKHHGYHKMPKLSKDAVDRQIDEWHPSMKQNIWELSGLFEGDIMEQEPEASKMAERNAVLDESLRWPDGEVPYHISKDFDEEEKAVIRGAMAEYHDKSCVRFRPYRRGDPDYVTIRGDAPGCWSYVGRRNGGQVVNLQGRCVQHGVAIHELLHALGFHHQQSASNRDDFVKIHWQNIRPRTRNNFKKYSSFRITDYDVPYDYGSIMHYSSHAFSRNGKPTITPLEEGARIGQRFGLSDSDTNKLNIMYGCEGGGASSGERSSPSHHSLSTLDNSWTSSFRSFWDSPFYF